MAAIEIPWNEMLEERRDIIKAGGERYNRALSVGENVEHWLLTGEALHTIQAEAMRLAKVNQPTGKGYNLFWRPLADAAAGDPPFRKMPKATRSSSLWLYEHWTVVEPWWKDLAPNVRAKVVHPTSIRLKFEAKDRQPKPKPVEQPVTLERLLVTTDDETLVNKLRKTKWADPDRRQELVDLLVESIGVDRKFAAQVDQLAADVAEVKAKRKAAKVPPPKRGRGRPPGVKNKPKAMVSGNGARLPTGVAR
jgi:hypothetical protein